jgi:hypothetical protein
MTMCVRSTGKDASVRNRFSLHRPLSCELLHRVEARACSTGSGRLGVVPEHVGLSGPRWRLRAAKNSQLQGGDPDEASR